MLSITVSGRIRETSSLDITQGQVKPWNLQFKHKEVAHQHSRFLFAARVTCSAVGNNCLKALKDPIHTPQSEKRKSKKKTLGSTQKQAIGVTC